MISQDLYFFDCFGMLIKRNAFSKERIDLANSVIDNAKEKRKDGGYKILDVFESHEVFIDFFVDEKITSIVITTISSTSVKALFFIIVIFL